MESGSAETREVTEPTLNRAPKLEPAIFGEKEVWCNVRSIDARPSGIREPIETILPPVVCRNHFGSVDLFERRSRAGNKLSKRKCFKCVDEMFAADALSIKSNTLDSRRKR